MNVHVRIGDNRTFTLKQAVLLYQEGSRAFATLHEVKHTAERSALFVRRPVGHDRVS